MEDTDGISINVFSSVDNDDSGENKKSQLKRPIGSDDEPSSGSVKKKKPNVGGRKDDTEGGNSSQSEFVSSLFNHNPEIPRLEQSEVKPLREEVFSAKAFGESGIHPYLVQNLSKFGVEQMTLVQKKAIPIIMASKDALIKSQTGSGKTLSYALPLLHKLQEMKPDVNRKSGVLALVVVPTRELAVQSFEWFLKLCKSFARIVPGMLIGGEKKKSEKARVRKGINILITTPGRLIDHIQHTECLSLANVSFLVLDEADRMLELGYERAIQTILAALDEHKQEGRQRQTLLLSATLTSGIEQLSAVSMKHPVFVDAAIGEEQETNREESLKTLTTPELLKQAFIIVPAKLRLVTLASFILWKCRFSKTRKVLVFMSTQDMVDFHCRMLSFCLNKQKKQDTMPDLEMTEDARAVLDKVRAKEDDDDGDEEDIAFLQLHGSMSQKDRFDVFRTFRDADSGVLLCTDVAARGLDLPHVDWIVQYNAPTCKADYVHRVGRTARIGHKGSALIFLLPSEAGFVKQLEEENLLLLEMTMDMVLQKLYKNCVLAESRRRPPQSVEEAATNLQMKMENAVVQRQRARSDDPEEPDFHSLASQAYVSFVRSYASYPKESRDVFCFKELHLGHLAKSFALRDPPTKITGLGKGRWVRNDERKRDNAAQKKEQRVINAQKKRINEKQLIMSEFSSGFDGIVTDASKTGGAKKHQAKKTFRGHGAKYSKR